MCGCVQLLCTSVQHSDVLQTMQLVFSGADVSFLLNFILSEEVRCSFCGFLSCVSILTRDIDIANLPLSVHLSVMFQHCMKTA